MEKLTGKLALVTGSSRGIGQQIALALAKEGCHLIIHGRKKDHTSKTLELLKPFNIDVDVIEGELSSKEDIQKMVDQVKAKHNRIDILYNNAAIQSPNKSIWDFKIEDFDRLLQINLYSVIQLCQAFAPAMRDNGYGRIINMTSGIKDQPNLSPYAVSKAALDKFTQDLAFELKDTGVLVNSLDPGWLKTDLGGPDAWDEVETVQPGALQLALFDNDGPTGQWLSAQEIRKSINEK
ncbi:NAD(P)-dependent dehydrogenase (short-subunit alcohol dehydrogenase family) [Bacillus mesophilus]|uniref:SDR family oxidoreductase n=1 Tax=Bacillus mesophilus TaxID=1808955 RepID=A0A6M0QEN5_9BACI|nr:SDR family oxidoreductase [Bacillus mesophilus]MBM7660125.1 NAD(P)-dependent dehydrogenase (short-subunit alcohol dehydrogenase family) [Bacillus mesophilus]NEY73778.1 SDR family oxidoreductase [Bacillus mesophilus]